MLNKLHISLIIRLCIGALLIFSASQKLINPYQNFLYVIQSYEFLNSFMEDVAARVVPWGELFLGIFLFLGLWLRFALAGSALLFLSFIIILGQALLRDLAISECGCFGEMITFLPQTMIGIDSLLLLMIVLLYCNIEQTKKLSLDAHFDHNEEASPYAQQP